MRLRPREGGLSTFTLERPAALFRDAQTNMAERFVPWLRRMQEQWRKHMKTAVEAFGPWMVRTRSSLRRAIVSSRERFVPFARQVQSQIHTRSKAALDALIPWLVRVGGRVRQGSREFAETAGPRLRATNESLQDRTVQTIEALAPRVEHARERVWSFTAAAKERLKAGVPIWATVLLVAVAALVSQVVAQGSVERRHEIETRQLTLIHQSEKAAAEARASNTLVRESDEAYRLLGSTVGWTIANTLEKKKNTDLELYFIELTKNDQIQLVVFADNTGKVTLASDPGMRGADFGRHFPATLLQDVAVSIHRGTADTNRLVVPVQRYGVRQGTAMLVYKAR